MRKQLGKFIEFSKGILPHEIEYLLKSNRLEDPDRLAILKRLHQNIQQFPPGESYDAEIDKRTYSHLKNWIVKQLSAVDVDDFYTWISQLDIKIVEDSIAPEEERALLKAVDQYAHPGFFFTKLFEVLQNYSNFLLIRFRYKDHARVNAFLHRYRADYLRHMEVQERIQEASAVVVREYSSVGEDGKAWRSWLSEIFHDEGIQGYLRYQCLIRLHYIDLRADDHRELLDMYALVGRYFENGAFYSKRILINYYHNMMLLNHKSRNWEEAVRYGRLATRAKTHDYLLYVNNLCDVLVHQERYEEGLSLLRGAAKEARNTNNFFNRIGFVSCFMRCMIGAGDPKGAVGFGGSFLAVYQKEIHKFRWYRFFRTYLEALLRSEKYGELIRVVRKNKLMEKESEMEGRADFVPHLRVMHELGRYLLGEVEKEDFEEVLTEVEEEPARRLLKGDLTGLDLLVLA